MSPVFEHVFQLQELTHYIRTHFPLDQAIDVLAMNILVIRIELSLHALSLLLHLRNLSDQLLELLHRVSVRFGVLATLGATYLSVALGSFSLSLLILGIELLLRAGGFLEVDRLYFCL